MNYYKDLISDSLKIKNNSYKDITSKWIGNLKNSYKDIKKFQLNEIFEYNGKKYVVDNHFVKYRLKQKEKNFAKWLSKNTGLKIQMNPEIEYPEKISVADCTIYRNDKCLGNYDMKIVTGESKQLLFHNVYKKNRQATKFLFETTESPLNMEDLIEQVNAIFERKATWVVEIGIKKKENFIILKNINIKK